MKNQIITRLNEIETEKNITILYACESGSRAWGFPSPDSDYDVRFIYIRDLDWYLSINPKKDHLDFQVTGDLDIHGWDIRKALKLLKKSNASLFEWMQSPIIYKNKGDFHDNFRNLSEFYFVPKIVANHYLGIARKSLKAGLTGNKFKLKKYFYVLRPLLSAMWIVERNGIPPLEFQKLLPLVQEKKELVERMEALLEKKKVSDESTLTQVDSVIRIFIEKEMEHCQEAVSEMKFEYYDVEPLNVFFRNLLISK